LTNAVTRDLIDQAVRFAHTRNELLNGTITNGIRLSVVFNARTGNCAVSYGITTQQWPGLGIPLSIGGKAPSGYLIVDHRLRHDPEGVYLADAASSFGLYRDEALDEPYFRYDYVRSQQHHAQAHLHLRAEFEHPLPQGVRPPKKLHFPTGGRRFRPTLEDVIEFCIREGFAEGRAGWEAVIQQHRDDWFDKQLRAAVRRYPQASLDTLRELGHV
jgi:hypothetical protein